MPRSQQIARIVGPTLIAVGVTEAINIDSFAGSAAPVVYLNGMVLFVAGLTIVQAHNRWVREWSVLVTLTGWVLFLGGLCRMFAPAAPQMSKGVATYGLLADSLAQLCDESVQPFDMIFIDADKPNNPAYLQWSLRLSRRGTLIVGDNVVRDGAIVDPENPDPRVQGVRSFLEMLGAEN
jgi:O-methyltransferase